MNPTRRPNPSLVPVSIALAVLPLSKDLPLWLIGACLLLLAAGLFLDLSKGGPSRPAVPAGLRVVLFLSGMAAALAVRGGETWMALLAVMLSLKPLEGNSYRHRMIGVIFTYFLIAAGVLFDQELRMGLYALLVVLFNTLLLLRLNQRTATPLRGQIRLLGRLLLIALPVTVVLFLLFPRLPGPLWGYRSEESAVTGFSDRLAPGEFASLVHDRSAAFRVEFAGNRPPRELLYWRGLVLWQSEGLHWQRGGQVPWRRNEPAGEGLFEYTVVLEPHNQRWLFGLDLPARISVEADFLLDDTIQARQRVKRKGRYSMVSLTAPAPRALSDWEARQALQLPPGNPEARALAAGWTAAAERPADRVAMGLDYFRNRGFVYTTEPQLLRSGDRVDEFLFRTRQGYCEHYAGAFAFLMRAAGVPARVVTGYLGGEENPLADYLIVRQADAHAWTEVWLTGRGWQRIDPTSIVSPARLTEGVEAALPAAERTGSSGLGRFLPGLPFLAGLTMGWDAMNLLWDNWVISYTMSRQRSLFDLLGLSRDFRAAAVVALTAACTLALFLALLVHYRPRFTLRQPREPVRRAYHRFCARLAGIGLPRKPWQGPRRYGEEVRRLRPDLAAPAGEITRLYEKLRYAEKGDGREVHRLCRLVKDFRPRRQA